MLECSFFLGGDSDNASKGIMGVCKEPAALLVVVSIILNFPILIYIVLLHCFKCYMYIFSIRFDDEMGAEVSYRRQ